jgi:hypothetical protein
MKISMHQTRSWFENFNMLYSKLQETQRIYFHYTKYGFLDGMQVKKLKKKIFKILRTKPLG